MSDHEYGRTPPLANNVAMYGDPVAPLASVAEVIASGGVTAKVIEPEADFVRSTMLVPVMVTEAAEERPAGAV